MKLKSIIAVLIITHLSVVSCSSEKWMLIKVDNSNIEALFPSAPLQESENMTFGGVGEMTANMASLEHDDVEYSIAYQETHSDTYIYTKEALYPIYMSKIGADIYEKKYITLGALEGVEYKMNVNGNKAIVQMIPDSNKTYNIIVIFPEIKVHDAEKFIQSVRIH